MQSEVETAVKAMKPGKSHWRRWKRLLMELLKKLGCYAVDALTGFFNKIYQGAVPAELKKSVFIILPKKSEAQDCSDFRTIA